MKKLEEYGAGTIILETWMGNRFFVLLEHPQKGSSPTWNRTCFILRSSGETETLLWHDDSILGNLEKQYQVIISTQNPFKQF